MIRTLLIFTFFLLTFVTASSRAVNYDEPPRIMAALQQGSSAERGAGIGRNYSLAIALYCDAASMGSPEGFFRIGRIYARGPANLRNRRKANGYLALAASLGHQEAAKYHDARVENADVSAGCGSMHGWAGLSPFDLDSYVSSLSAPKRKVAALIRSMAPKYGVDTRFALSIALAESNLEPRAVSPKNAQGVMQLIPATQERFGIKNAFDPAQNIRGGLTYLRWLQNRFAGNRMFVAAAYNAGEGMVDKYGGIPPFAETRQYVSRVIYFSGAAAPEKKKD